jgi:KaiC/GvpD/RAD55 family RecA-like ATPase
MKTAGAQNGQVGKLDGSSSAAPTERSINSDPKKQVFYSPLQVEALPDLKWLVQGVLPMPGFGVLFGEPGCGKTFVALSLALSLANGGEWLGRKVQKTKVLYIAAEGIYGLKHRVSAFRKTLGIEDGSVLFSANPINVLEEDEVKALIASLVDHEFCPDLIIVDTLARVTVGADENNSKDMGRAVYGLDRLKEAFNAFVLVIHHTTKNGGSERGSSALRGAADVMIECVKAHSKNGLAVTLECSKMKDCGPFKAVTASLEKVELPGNASSLVMGGAVDPTDEISDLNGDRILDILSKKFGDSGASNSELLAAFDKADFGSKSTFDRALRSLKKQDALRVEGRGKGVKYFPLGVSVKPVS